MLLSILAMENAIRTWILYQQDTPDWLFREISELNTLMDSIKRFIEIPDLHLGPTNIDQQTMTELRDILKATVLDQVQQNPTETVNVLVLELYGKWYEYFATQPFGFVVNRQ